nr:PREDICTED: facilitated trehalose transporter Tret1-like isoform X1 [Bemisia tabaci]XP_018912955.1 PREDICTED: facilitated trehalose transporter Tret1-like isoform X1 [Bemisia tabaci]XP_018912956.1 PREDICTED: facilitated trehalose transporter Tret1-like isoform X1 [Bemisia tabaci]
MGKVEMHSSEKVYRPCEMTTSNVNNVKSTVAQFYATFVECCFLILVGMIYMMPTIVVGALHKTESSNSTLTSPEDEAMRMDDHTASWIGSIVLMSHPVGALTSGFVSERFGRRGAMMLGNVPFLGCWVLYYLATSVKGLFIASMLMGFTIGLCEAPMGAYLSESCEPRFRGISNSMVVAFCTMGNSLELFLGSAFHWRTSALVGVSVPVICFLGFLTVPESPVWLITKGRLEEAHKALAWFRGFAEPQHVREEFDDMVRYSMASSRLSRHDLSAISEEKAPLDGKHNIQDPEKSQSIKRGNWLVERWRELSNPRLYLPLRMVLITFFFTQSAGLVPFKAFIIEILNEFWFPFDNKWAVVATGVASFLGSVGATILVKLAGKRLMCIICMIISTISIFVLGFSASFFRHQEDLLLSWLILSVFAVVHFVGNVGVINIPWMLSYEVYPVRARGMANGISAASGCFMAFLQTKTYLDTERAIGLDGVFYAYGVVALAGCIYVILYIPETEGKSMEQIETYFTPHHDRKEKYRMPSKKNRSKA